MKAAILGMSGYTGSLLFRLLDGHPDVEQIIPSSTSKAGQMLNAVDRGLDGELSSKLILTGGRLATVEETVRFEPDVVFAALPHLKSAELCSPFFGKSVVIDLSADFRIRDTEIFKDAYGSYPPRPDLLDLSVYGLAECFREEIKGSDLIANPGCYPTAALIPLIPLAETGCIAGRIVINAISGISGAGRKVKENLLFCERSENLGAYLPGKTHRHWPEIESVLRVFAPASDVIFTPHLAPLRRGIHTTVYVLPAGRLTGEDLEKVYTEAYGDAPFVCLRRDALPATADVLGSNRCDLAWHLEDDYLLIFSVIDNLMKGASGQAVQNMNIRFGLDEKAGLPCHNEI